MKRIWIILFCAFVFRIILSFLIWHPDLNNHADWGIRFFQYGADKFYAPESNVWNYTWPNQPPGTIYIFAGIRRLFEFIFSVLWFINIKIQVFPSNIITFFERSLYPALLKFPGILADLGIGYLIYKITKKEWATALWLFNPVVWYNSSLWGQYDSVIGLFALLSFYFLLRRKLFFAIFAFAISIYIKASLLIFLPIFIIFAIRQRYKIIQYLLSVIGTLTVIVLISLPFSEGNVFVWLYNLYQDKVFIQQLHLITANAFNLWAGVVGIHEKPEILMLGPVSYKVWGQMLFIICYLPGLYFIWKKQDIKTLFWVLGVGAFSSFMLLANMHERYLYPLFAPLTILLVLNMVSFIPYAFISLISLLNLYNFWWFPKISFLVNFLSSGDRLMPRILGLVLFGFFVSFYLNYLRLLKPGKI